METTPPLKVEVERLPAAAIIRLIGEANVQQSGQMERELTMLSALRPPQVVIDLSQLTFISSLALGMLVEFQRGLARNHVKVVLAGLPPKIREVFRSTTLEQLFTMVDRPEDALNPS